MMVAMMMRTIPPTIDAGRMIGMRISVKNGVGRWLIVIVHWSFSERVDD